MGIVEKDWGNSGIDETTRVAIDGEKTWKLGMVRSSHSPETGSGAQNSRIERTLPLYFVLDLEAMMIGYFVQAGDKIVGDSFIQYLWPFRDLFEKKIKITKYSQDLDLIIIAYIIEGEFLRFPQKDIKFKGHNKIEKVMSVEVGVHNNFSELSEDSKREFIVASSIRSVEIVQQVLIRKKLDSERFPELLLDLQLCINQYRSLKIS